MATIVITGTSSGIGLATALELGRAGHKVYATMRNPARAPQLGEQVAHEALPVSILTMDVDRTNRSRTALQPSMAKSTALTFWSTMLESSGMAR